MRRCDLVHALSGLQSAHLEKEHTDPLADRDVTSLNLSLLIFKMGPYLVTTSCTHDDLRALSLGACQDATD